jgi:hypothetical protein
LRQDGDGGGRGVDAAAGLGFGHPLDAVDAGFELQARKDAFAGDHGDDFLVAAGIALGGGNHLDFPAAVSRVALVHAEQIAGEQRRFQSAGAGADFENGAAFIGGILGQQHDFDLLLELADPAP